LLLLSIGFSLFFFYFLYLFVFFFFFFFFQAEDGIRDFHVTGVQTCALPIFVERSQAAESIAGEYSIAPVGTTRRRRRSGGVSCIVGRGLHYRYDHLYQIGRASCRERV